MRKQNARDNWSSLIYTPWTNLSFSLYLNLPFTPNSVQRVCTFSSKGDDLVFSDWKVTWYMIDRYLSWDVTSWSWTWHNFPDSDTCIRWICTRVSKSNVLNMEVSVSTITLTFVSLSQNCSSKRLVYRDCIWVTHYDSYYRSIVHYNGQEIWHWSQRKHKESVLLHKFDIIHDIKAWSFVDCQITLKVCNVTSLIKVSLKQ